MVDDQPEILTSVAHLLSRDGHRVLTAEGGEAALGLLEHNEVHLVLVDYFMPRMNGEELVRRIRSFDPVVQIILQTGYSGEKPPRVMLADLEIQGYHDKGDGPDRLLLWVDVGLKAHRLIQQLRERERTYAELVANVSHELRTPLNIIKGYTELVLDGEFGELPDPVRHPITRIEEASRNLGGLVSDFLAYAKLEAGVHETGEHEIVLRDVVTEFDRLAGVLLEDREVAFELDVSRAPVSFVADAIKLRTVLRNLLTNAAKFTNSGSIRMVVEPSEGSLHFSVEDTGPGIRKEDCWLIFEPFRQIDGSSTRAHGGIGLGLALSLKLARLMGGDLTVRSEVGRGSTFTLTLPLRAAVDVDGVDSAPVSLTGPQRAAVPSRLPLAASEAKLP